MAVLGLLWASAGCSVWQGERATETLALPAGELLTNEYFLPVGRDGVWHNSLFFQQNASSVREAIGEIIDKGSCPLSMSNSAPRLYRNADRVALVIGSHVFKRWSGKAGPFWYHASTLPDPTASVFLRSFLKPGDSRIGSPPAGNIRGQFDVPMPTVSYAFAEIDLDQNILVTRRESSDTLFPEFLVYSARRYDFTWCFDIERTRSANRLKPPPDSNLIIDFSAVAYPGALKPFIRSRDAVLAIPGATEIHAQSLPLKAGAWTSAEYSFPIPGGTTVTNRFDALLGFVDPLPRHLSICWRRHPVLWDDWHFTTTDDWVCADASGYADNVSRIVFFRVRRLE